jgi:hypothetical protein
MAGQQYLPRFRDDTHKAQAAAYRRLPARLGVEALKNHSVELAVACERLQTESADGVSDEYAN